MVPKFVCVLGAQGEQGRSRSSHCARISSELGLVHVQASDPGVGDVRQLIELKLSEHASPALLLDWYLALAEFIPHSTEPLLSEEELRKACTNLT